MILLAVIAFTMWASVSGCRVSSTADRSAPVVAAFPLKDYIAKANEAYAARADPPEAKEAYDLMVVAHKANPKDYEAAWLLAKYAYFLGGHTLDKGAAIEIFTVGADAGEMAVAIDANKPEGHFWYAACMGGRAQLSSLDGAADADDIRTNLEAVIKLQPDFQSGSAYMALGLLDLDLPRLFGGNPRTAVTQMEAGLKYGEPNSLFHLGLAQAYNTVGRKEDARKQIEFIQQMKPDPDYLPEHADALKGASELAAKL